jgi:hypothetical protein
MTAMSQPGENASGKVIRLEARRVERRVPGIGTAVFRAPNGRRNTVEACQDHWPPTASTAKEASG